MPSSVSASTKSPPTARRVIDPYLQKLGSIPRNAWEAYRELYGDLDRFHDKSAVAKIVHRLMVHAVQKVSTRTKGLEYYEPYPKMHVVVVEERVVIRFKKLDENHRRANVKTGAQEEINLGQLSLFGGRIREWITVGYMTNETRTECLSVWAVKHGEGGDPTWKTKIREEGAVDYKIEDFFDLDTKETRSSRDREEHAPLKLKKTNVTQEDEPVAQESES